MKTITVLKRLLKKYEKYLEYANNHTLKETRKRYPYTFGLCEQLGLLMQPGDIPARLMYELRKHRSNINIRRPYYGYFWFPSSGDCYTKRELIRHCLNPRIRLLKLAIKEETKLN